MESNLEPNRPLDHDPTSVCPRPSFPVDPSKIRVGWVSAAAGIPKSLAVERVVGFNPSLQLHSLRKAKLSLHIYVRVIPTHETHAIDAFRKSPQVKPGRLTLGIRHEPGAGISACHDSVNHGGSSDNVPKVQPLNVIGPACCLVVHVNGMLDLDLICVPNVEEIPKVD